MKLTIGWRFASRLGMAQLLVHFAGAMAFALCLAYIVQYGEAYEKLFVFWVTGPLPLLLVFPLVLAVPRMTTYERAIVAAVRGERCPDPDWTSAGRQLLGQSSHSTAMSALQWLINVAGVALMLSWQNHESSDRLLQALLIGAGVFTPLVAIAVGLATDRAIRPYVSLLFPDGRPSRGLSKLPSLDGRLLVAFTLCGPAASGIMAAIAYQKSNDILTSRDGYMHLQALLGMEALALGATFVVALIFKQLIARDVLSGLVKASDALDRLARGDRDVRIPVDSIDEIGRLCEKINDLSDILAQREPAAAPPLVEILPSLDILSSPIER